MEPKVIAIVVNHNNYSDTEKCVHSLLNQSFPLYRIVIVDNCSPNSSYEILKRSFSKDERIIVIKTPKNGGYAYGVNYGIAFANKKLKYEYVLVINNDTIADPQMVEELLKVFKMYENVGIATGRIFYFDEPDKIWFDGGYFSRIRGTGYHYNQGKKQGFDGLTEITFATGCLWLIKRSVYEKVGKVPEEYFLYLEDVDYSLRMLKEGYKIVLNPNAKIWHKISASTGINKKIPNYRWGNRNRIILAKKFFSKVYVAYIVVYLTLTKFIRFLQHLFFHGSITNTFSGILEGLLFKIENKS